MNEISYMPLILDTVYIIEEQNDKKSTKPEEKSPTGIQTDKQKPNVQFGEYYKKILITTDNQLIEKSKVLLIKIFDALNIKISDILVTTSPIRLKSLANYDIEKPKFMIHFTNDECVKYKFITQDDIHVLYSDSLATLGDNQDLKLSLWNSIKDSLLSKVNPK